MVLLDINKSTVCVLKKPQTSLQTLFCSENGKDSKEHETILFPTNSGRTNTFALPDKPQFT